MDRLNLKPEELCRRREWVFPAHLTAQQIRALEMLKAKRDLFL